MINHLALIQKLKKFGHPPDTWLPWDYQTANPKGRTTHDDWAIPFLRGIKRIDTAYAIPLPFRKIAGTGNLVWMPIRNPEYPLAPGAVIVNKPFDFGDGKGPVLCRWVETMMSIHEGTAWSRQEAYINGAWTECYFTRSWTFWGKRFTWYDGLKLDQDGPMAWYPEASASIQRG